MKSSCEKICAGLNEIRKKGEYCDIKLKVGDEIFECHRVVLAATNEFFRTMINSDFKEKEASIIVLSNDVIHPSVFELILEFLYTGKTQITSNNAFWILKTSHFLGMEKLEEECSDYIKRNGDIEYLVETAEYFLLLGRDSCFESSVYHILKRINDFRKSEKFLTLPYSVFYQFVKKAKQVFSKYETCDGYRYPSYHDESEYDEPSCYYVVTCDDQKHFIQAIFDWVNFHSKDKVYVLNEILQEIASFDTYKIIMEKYFRFLIKEKMGRIDPNQCLKILCSSEMNDNSNNVTSMISFNIEGGESVFTEYSIKIVSNRETIIKFTRFKDWYYCLTLDKCQSKPIANNFYKFQLDLEDSILELLKPPFVTTNYSITTIGATMYLYDSSKQASCHKVDALDTSFEHNSIIAYNFENDEWLSIKKIPQRLFHSYLAAIDETLYLIGGCKKFDLHSKKQNIIQCFDTRSSKWTVKPIDEQLSLNGTVCVHRNEIYIYEKQEAQENKAFFYVYDVEIGKFKSVKIEGGPSEPGFLVSNSFEDVLWYIYQQCEGSSSVQGKIYRPLRNQWDGELIIHLLRSKYTKSATIFDGQFS